MSALDTPHRGFPLDHEVVERPDEVVDLVRGRSMPTSLQCAECLPKVQTFSGPGYWNAYAIHLRTEHPQTIPTPPQRPETPVAPSRPSGSAGRKEAPTMARIPCREGCTAADNVPKSFDTPHGEDVHFARVHGPNAVAPAPKVRSEGNGDGPVVAPQPAPGGRVVDEYPTVIYSPPSPAAVEVAPKAALAPPRHGGSLPAYISFDALAPHLEDAELALRKALERPLHVRFENGYSVALVDVEDIEVLVQGQRVIHLTAEDREGATA